MKKHLSVIALLIAIRFKVIMSFLAILIGFNLLSLVSYSLIFKESLTKFNMVVFEEWLGIFFVIIFLFFFAATAYECKSEKGYSKYTRIRLRIPERMLAGWEGAVCAAGFLLFWQAEVIFIFCMGEVRNMGGLGKILDMLPGVNKKNVSEDDIDKGEKEFRQMEAIIRSMTLEERRNPALLNASRRKRIAQGAGQSVAKVNQLIKKYEDAKKLMKQFNNPNFMKKSRFRGLF